MADGLSDYKCYRCIDYTNLCYCHNLSTTRSYPLHHIRNIVAQLNAKNNLRRKKPEKKTEEKKTEEKKRACSSCECFAAQMNYLFQAVLIAF